MSDSRNVALGASWGNFPHSENPVSQDLATAVRQSPIGIGRFNL